MVYIFISIVLVDLLIFGGLGLLIIKNKRIYNEEEGRWISGFNLPRLYSEPGDVIDHEGFRRHVGFSLIRFGVLFTGILCLFIYMLENEYPENIVLPVFLVSIFGSVFYLMWDMYTRSEQFIERYVSTKINYEKYLYRMMLGISVVNTVPIFLEENITQGIIAAIVLTFYIVGYYIYKIYKILKENRKDFL